LEDFFVLAARDVHHENDLRNREILTAASQHPAVSAE
jgi:hypothetical protein